MCTSIQERYLHDGTNSPRVEARGIVVVSGTAVAGFPAISVPRLAMVREDDELDGATGEI